MSPANRRPLDRASCQAGEAGARAPPSQAESPRTVTCQPTPEDDAPEHRRPDHRRGDASLLDVVDNLLNRGVVLNADVILSLANVDLVYLRLSALLCAADRLLPGGRR